MQRYTIAYLSWLVGIITMAAIGLAWYKHVEGIGLRELANRINETPGEAPAGVEV